MLVGIYESLLLDDLRSLEGRVGIVQPGGIGNSTFVLFLAFGGLSPCKWIYGLCYLVLSKLTSIKIGTWLKQILAKKV